MFEQARVSHWDRSLRIGSIAWPLGLTALILATFLTFPYFPNQDGPAHINSAFVLDKIARGNTYFSEFFENSGIGITNWFAHVLISMFIGVLDPSALAFLIATVCILAFAGLAVFTTRYLLQAPAGAELLFLPIIVTHMLQMGSFNLTMTYPLFIPLLGLCYREANKHAMSNVVAVALLLVCTFLIHVQVALISMCCVLACAFWCLINRLAQDRNWAFMEEISASHPNRTYASIGALFAATLPILSLAAWFVLSNTESLPSTPQYAGLAGKAVHLIFLSSVASYSVFGLAVNALLFVLIALGLGVALLKYRIAGLNAGAQCLLLCALSIFAVWLVVPNGLGDSFNIEERIGAPLLIVVACFLAVTLAKLPHAPGVIAGAVTFVLLLQATDRIIAMTQIQPKLAEIDAVASQIPERSGFLFVSMDRVAEAPQPRSVRTPFKAITRFDPYWTFVGQAVAGRDIAYLQNYQAYRSKQYFPINQKDWLHEILGPHEGFPLGAERLGKVLTHFESAPARADYLILWNDRARGMTSPAITKTMEVILEQYEPYGEANTSLVTLYRLIDAR